MLFAEAWVPLPVTVTIAFVIGLLIGSFLNVVIHRIPLGLSIVVPRSSCPSCSKPVAALDNIPILSFLLLRGRCRYCKERISGVYPLVELTTAVLFSLLVWLHGPSVLAEMWFASVMLVLAVIDARHHILPDRITYPSLVIATVASISRSPVMADLDILIASPEPGFSAWRTALTGSAVILLASAAPWLLDQLDVILFDKYFDWVDEEGQTDGVAEDRSYGRLIRSTVVLGLVLAVIWVGLVFLDSHRDPGLYQAACDRLVDAGLGALVAGGVLWVVRAGYFYLRGAEGMGLGDVKLMMAIGAFFGWPGAVMVLLIASIIGLVMGLAMARRSGKGLKTELPLGACIGLAAIAVLLLLEAGTYSWM
ncbi:MAG: prepilin peptidase [Acidobacteriota bacterium]